MANDDEDPFDILGGRPVTRITNKVHRQRVLDALRGFYEGQTRLSDGSVGCPKRPGRPCCFSGYPRAAARCRFCWRKRDGGT